MSTNLSTPSNPTALVNAVLSVGVKNLWYPVAASWEVGGAPLGVTRLGEQIVLWRDDQHQVHALEDRCPHRGARLSLGWNLGSKLACWYHGVEVNGQGIVDRVPATSGCSLEGRQCVKSYPVQERAGAIFLWFGDELHPDPSVLELPEELTNDEEFANFLCVAHWKCNYQYAMENIMDPMHGAYLHASSHSMASGDKHAQMQVRETDAGFAVEKVGQRDINFDWVELGETGVLWARLAIPYQKKYGPGGGFGVVAVVAPVDEFNCQLFAWRTRKVKGWERDAWRFLYRNRLEGLHWAVLEQDRIVLENLAPAARSRESLYQHDIGITRLRRVLRQRAKQQVDDALANQAKQ